MPSLLALRSIRASSLVRTFLTSSYANNVPSPIRGSQLGSEHEVKVRICGELYQELKEAGNARYRNAPVDGITAKVAYYDNSMIVGSRPHATVLALPGTPGSLHDYRHLCSHLTSRGVRVISITYPGNYNI